MNSSVLNITCPICTDIFRNVEDIYSTSCGHIFHYKCMCDWQQRSTSCPQCRAYNPTTHKLYLSFEDLDTNTEDITEINAQLESAKEKITKLEDQLNETEFNFLQLQKQFTVSQQSISKLENSEQNFYQLQGQYTESTETLKDLQDYVQLLNINYESKSKELKLKCREIEKLKASMEVVESKASDLIVSDKTKILEQKLKHLSLELEKEITISTQLSIDKIKLQSYIDRINLNSNALKIVHDKNQNEVKKKQQFAKASNTHNETIEKLKSSEKNDNSDNDNANTILIRSINIKQLIYPLENFIINLALKMGFVITSDEICKVNLLVRQKQTMLFAKFKTTYWKDKFLSNRKMLKKYPTTRNLMIREYVDNEVQLLFDYANRKLRGNGFNYIYCNKNGVFAKKEFNSGESIQINNRNQVNDLLKNKSSILAEASITENCMNKNVDENFYQL